MSDLANINPQDYAKDMAGYDVLALKNVLTKQTNSLKAQQTALSALRTALSSFRTTLDKTNEGMLKNAATTSIEGVAKVTVASSAQKGSYNLFVKQLASSHQVAYDNLSDEAIAEATGSLSLSINGKSFDIDMSELTSLADLSRAINNAEDNPGVTASLIRTNGNVSLMLSSDETGEQNVIELNTDGMDPTSAALFDPSNQETISRAADAIFRLGDSPKEYTSASNTLDTLIEGVTIELKKAQKEGDEPLRISVGTDAEATKEQVQNFVDAYNSLLDSLSALTARGGGDKERGAFAGDSGISSLSFELNNILRTTFCGKDMTAFGITADKNGHLSINSEKFDDALKADPASLNAFFNGNDGLNKQMDKALDKYLSTNGLLKGRQETLDRQQTALDERAEKISARYESSYNRHLKQFTRLQSILAQMDNTMSMFS